MYQSPPFEIADRLCTEIEQFLESCGGPYAEQKPYVAEHILICIALGQFLWKRDQYFVGWWMVDKERLEQIEEHIRPYDLNSGTIMYIPECGCKDVAGMVEIRRRLRKRGIKEVHWHRGGKGWQHFTRQKGARYGNQ